MGTDARPVIVARAQEESDLRKKGGPASQAGKKCAWVVCVNSVFTTIYKQKLLPGGLDSNVTDALGSENLTPRHIGRLWVPNVPEEHVAEISSWPLSRDEG